jgi:ketopantoate reductase
MKAPIVVVGLGEMGGVFARGFLSNGHPVFPVRRHDTAADLAVEVPDPALVLITVGENDLGEVLAHLPEAWRSRTGMIQNELLPRDWAEHGIEKPTVASVWFEKKPGKPVKVIIPTPVAGPNATLIVDALAAIDLPASAIADADLIDALVAKNLYILTANIAGLRTGGTVSELWSEHRELGEAVAAEVLDIQEHLVGAPLDGERAMAAMVTAIQADPDHGATGRSASSRLERARRHAAAAGIDTPTLDAIARES